MSSTVLCAVILTVAVDWGYEPLPDDGIRYLIRIEPHMLDTLRDGEFVSSDIDPAVRGRVHAFRIVSNNEPLPKAVPPLTTKSASEIALPPTLPEIAEPPVLGNPPSGERVPVPSLPASTYPWSELEEHPSSSDHSLRPVLDPGHVLQAVAQLPEEPRFPDERLDADSPSGEPATPQSEPWVLLVLAFAVAAGSSSGMVYFGWLALDYRSRYLTLLRDTMRPEPCLNNLRDTTEVDAADNTFPSIASSLIRFSPDRQIPDTLAAEDPAWNQLGEEDNESVGKWLDDNADRRQRSHRDGNGTR